MSKTTSHNPITSNLSLIPGTSNLLLNLTLPVQIHSPQNSYKGHWASSRKKQKAQKQSILLALLPSGHLLQKNNHQPITITLTRISPRKMDHDNFIYGCKWIKDAIAEVIFPNLPSGRADDSPILTWDYVQVKGPPKQHQLSIQISLTQPSIS